MIQVPKFIIPPTRKRREELSDPAAQFIPLSHQLHKETTGYNLVLSLTKKCRLSTASKTHEHMGFNQTKKCYHLSRIVEKPVFYIINLNALETNGGQQLLMFRQYVQHYINYFLTFWVDMNCTSVHNFGLFYPSLLYLK